MKSRISRFIAALVLLLSFESRATHRDTTLCLKLEAVFENAFDRDRRSCRVEVLRNDSVVDVVELKRLRKKFVYYFDAGCCYTLRVEKPGFAPLLIAVDTKSVPREDAVYHFGFSTRLISERRANTFNRQAMQLPLAVIRYDFGKDNFYYDETYTDQLKTRMVLAGSWR